MSSVQERLQLKRVPLDSWNIREQLCLASAVVRSGDQNWMSVSRNVKTVGDPNRPADWYSQKSCAAQYGALLEHVETPKRKKRNSEGAGETPQESILKRLTAERIAEIQKTLAEMNQQHTILQNEIAEIRNPATSEERIKELWSGVEAHNRAREKEIARRAAWLREREERRARASRNWRPGGGSPSPSPTTPPQVPPSSPLLTSLLKSTPAATTPQHMPHPASVVDSVSPSAGAPTLSMLLEKSQTPSASLAQERTSPQESKHAAIEHIKSQLVLIEQRLRAGASTPPAVLPEQTPALDIDDIEIKAEDVYAFRDVDIELPPVAAMHKAPVARLQEKTEVPKKDDSMSVPTETSATDMSVDVSATEGQIEVDTTFSDGSKDEIINVETIQEPPQPEPESDIQVPETPSEPEVKRMSVEEEVAIAFPEVKFPTPEIKVIQNEDLKLPEDIKEEETTSLNESKIKIQEDEKEEEVIVAAPPTEDNVIEPETPATLPEVPPEVPLPTEPKTEKEQKEETILDLTDIPLPPGSPAAINKSTQEPPEESTLPPPLPETTPEAEPEPEVVAPPEPEPDIATEESSQEDDKTLEELKKEVIEEESTPLQDIRAVLTSRAEVIAPDPAPAPALAPAPKEDAPETDDDTPMEEKAPEIDDDTPMELSREEEKDGKKKRDYSRKKKPESRTCSGSESAASLSAPPSPSPPTPPRAPSPSPSASASASPSASASASPASSSAAEAERQHRLWKKSVMLVYGRLCAHKYASLFLRPISDEQAPGYSAAVRRPTDLAAIRRRVDSGQIRSTAEFSRAVLLMLSNALMYNSRAHRVHHLARELLAEAKNELSMLVAAQAHAGLAPAPRRRRHAADSPRSVSVSAKRPHL